MTQTSGSFSCLWRRGRYIRVLQHDGVAGDVLLFFGHIIYGLVGEQFVWSWVKHLESNHEVSLNKPWIVFDYDDFGRTELLANFKKKIWDIIHLYNIHAKANYRADIVWGWKVAAHDTQLRRGANKAPNVEYFHIRHGTDMVITRRSPCRTFFICSHTKTAVYQILLLASCIHLSAQWK